MNAGENLLLKAKSLGFSDRQIAALVGSTEDEVRALRKKLGIVAEFPVDGHVRVRGGV
jgi:hypothetical protein